MSGPSHRRRVAGAVTASLVLAVAAFPPGAAAHGLVGRTDLPVPTWLFAWGAGIVLVLSFAALGSLWPTPRLQQRRLRPLFRVPRFIEPICGLIGVLVFGAVVYAGLAGTEVPTSNLAPTFVYVILWVGVPVLSVILGDVFRLFSPWRALARAAAWLTRGAELPEPAAYPAWLGRWPAVLGLFGFAWLELVYVNRDDPALLATLGMAYAAVQLVGMALFGEEAWTRRADPFAVYFSLFARLSPFERRDGTLCLRTPLSGVTDLELVPGTVALLCVLIGTTTFDGASNGALWTDVASNLMNAFAGLGPNGAGELAASIGLVVCIAIVSALYWVGIRGVRGVTGGDTSELGRRFAHSLAPIAFAYVLAHYFSLLVFQGQAIGYLASDPLGHGSDVLGTADFQVNYNLIGAAGIWYVQVAALVAGHVGGLVLAHDRALVLFRRPAEAVRSQYWMLLVMVGFTCLALWLISAVAT